VVLAAGITVTLLTRAVTGRDADGNDVYGSTALAVAGCAFDPGGSVELVQGQDLVTTQPKVYLPAGTVVGALSAVIVAGVTYEVEGSPNSYTSPFTGWSPGIEVKLKAVTG
jgi:hypothetical protein